MTLGRDDWEDEIKLEKIRNVVKNLIFISPKDLSMQIAEQKVDPLTAHLSSTIQDIRRILEISDEEIRADKCKHNGHYLRFSVKIDNTADMPGVAEAVEVHGFTTRKAAHEFALFLVEKMGATGGYEETERTATTYRWVQQ